MAEAKFAPRTLHYKLLRGYWQHVGGTMFTEVRAGKHSPKGEVRSIDGVRVVTPAPPNRELRKFTGHQDEFKRLVSGAIVEAIEVSEYLHRWVIGQAVVGKHLLEIEHGVRAAIPVVVCRHWDQLLEQVCARLGVKVWMPRRYFVVS